MDQTFGLDLGKSAAAAAYASIQPQVYIAHVRSSSKIMLLLENMSDANSEHG